MAASCCLAPIFTLIGIVGILQGSKKPDTKPKILVFGPGGLPTTEELYNSINQIEKKEVSASLHLIHGWKVVKLNLRLLNPSK